MSDETQAAAPEAAPSSPKRVLLIGALVGGLVLGGVAGVVFAGPAIARAAGFGAPVAKSEAKGEETAGDHEEKKGGEHGEKGEKPGHPIHALENLVLNPAGSGGTRFLMVAVAIELEDEKINEQLTARDAELRDQVLRLFGSKSVEQLSEMPTRDILKQEISDSLSAKFGKKAIRRVYFPQFVIQ